MADIKFSEFPNATTSKDSDEIAILQDGVNKMIASPILESKIINKTVSRVIEQGGASLNLINLKGVVPTYADLSTITPTPELNDAYQVEVDGLVYIYTENGFQVDGEGIKVQPEPIGVVEEDNPNAVSGGEVYDSIIEFSEILNITNLFPLTEGFYNFETARNAVPINLRKAGLIITYQTADRVWETQQYIHSVAGTAWLNTENWVKINKQFDTDKSILELSNDKIGLNMLNFIDRFEVSVRNESNLANYIDLNSVKKIAIFGFGFLSGDSTYNFSLTYYNGSSWISQPAETRYKSSSNALSFTFNFYQFKIDVVLKSWATTYTSYQNETIINKSIFNNANLLNLVNKNDNLLFSLSTGADVDNLINQTETTVEINMPSVTILCNSINNVVQLQNNPNSAKKYILKRQEFLYVDVPLRYVTGLGGGFTATIQHGNYVANVTDERGTILKAPLETTDKTLVRIILFAVGYSANQYIFNRLPQTPTKEQVKKIVNDMLPPIDNDQLVKASTFQAKNKLREEQLRTEYQNKVDTDSYVGKWYGVQYTEQDTDNTTRINSVGDDTLHHSLPIQSLMRRCVVKKGIVQYYLDADNSELKEDGVTPSKLDGTDGNVMVEIPEFFFKFEEDTSGANKVVRIKISQDAFPDFIFSPKRYTSAYEATIDRDLNKLVSVCTTEFTRANQEIFIESASFYAEGTSSDYSLGTQKTSVISGYTANATKYRGGTNDNALDSASGTQISRCQLGRPIANVRRGDLKPRLKEDEFIYLYDTHKILWILAYTEFAKRNIQQPIQVKNPNDVTYGGLGQGSTVYPDYDSHANFYTPYGGISLLPCGVTNNLGNKSGEVYFKIQNAPVESTGDKETYVTDRYDNVWMPVMSYRGVEQYYGHIYKVADQVSIIAQSTGEYVDGHDGDSTWQITDTSYYYESNPYLTTEVANSKKLLWRGDFQAYSRYNKLLLGENGHLLPIDGNGFDYYTAYADCVEIFPQGSNVLYPTFNGRIVSGRLVGYNFIVGHNYNTGTPRASDGTRLDCF